MLVDSDSHVLSNTAPPAPQYFDGEHNKCDIHKHTTLISFFPLAIPDTKRVVVHAEGERSDVTVSDDSSPGEDEDSDEAEGVEEEGEITSKSCIHKLLSNRRS